MSSDSTLDVTSCSLAEMLSEPMLESPLCVGLYGKWGNNVMFMLNKIKGTEINFYLIINFCLQHPIIYVSSVYASGSQPLMACRPLLEFLNSSGPCAGRKLAVAISNRLKTKLRGIFPEFSLKTKKGLLKSSLKSKKSKKKNEFLLKNKKKGLHLKSQVFIPEFFMRDFPEFLFT